VGFPFHGRTRPELEKLIGYFIKVLPIRIAISSDDKLQDLVDHVRTDVLRCIANALPLSMIASAVMVPHDSSRTPIFQAYFTL
jgi:non-ribosomal peptide synthetase component F